MMFCYHCIFLTSNDFRACFGGFRNREMTPILRLRLVTVGTCTVQVSAAKCQCQALFGKFLRDGAGKGLLTIARGTLPLALFGPAGYRLRAHLLSAKRAFCKVVRRSGFRKFRSVPLLDRLPRYRAFRQRNTPVFPHGQEYFVIRVAHYVTPSSGLHYSHSARILCRLRSFQAVSWSGAALSICSNSPGASVRAAISSRMPFGSKK